MEKPAENQKRCQCNDLILKGRSDKKFCNTKCKNDYHNLINRKQELIFKHDKSNLQKNYKALKMYYEHSKGKDFIQIRPLLQEGFDPRFYIGTMILKNTGETVYLVYDYAFFYDQKLGIKIFYQDGGFHNI